MEIKCLNLLRLLHAERIECVVGGGYAGIAHGLPRATGGIDLLVQPTAETTGRVVETEYIPVR